MVEQVRMRDTYLNSSGQISDRLTPIFAFGTHPQVTSEDQAHPVTSAKAVNNKLRVIMDELLIGNNLEQIACRAPVNADGSSYDTVPLGSTPDDIARCSVAKDVLKGSCPKTFEHAVCLCHIDAGCGDVASGDPVGVLDVNQDGAADDTRFMPGAVGIKCGTIDVPIDLNVSYWNPSGDQQVPAMGGFDALGPAIVLQSTPPAGCAMCNSPVLPTNLTCGLVFSPSVTDKQLNQVCAPKDGDITQDCTPGDVSQFSFKTQPLIGTIQAFNNGDTGVSRVDPVSVGFTAPVQPTSITGITVTEGSTPYTQFTATQPFPDSVKLTWTAATGLAATTTYTITIGTTVTDYYGQPVPMPITYTFTTGN